MGRLLSLAMLIAGCSVARADSPVDAGRDTERFINLYSGDGGSTSGGRFHVDTISREKMLPVDVYDGTAGKVGRLNWQTKRFTITPEGRKMGYRCEDAK
jgi:hypothetical protein